MRSTSRSLKPEQQEAEGGEQGGFVHDEAAGRQQDVEAPHTAPDSKHAIIYLRAVSRKKFRKAVDSSSSDEIFSVPDPLSRRAPKPPCWRA